MVAGPDDRVSCRSPAGIHSARVGGSTQVASAVLTVSTPLAAQASWWSSWVCQSNTSPAGIGKRGHDHRAVVLLSIPRHKMAGYALGRRHGGP